LGHRALALRCEQRLASVHWIVFDDHVEAIVWWPRCPCGAWRIPEAPSVLMCHSAAACRQHPRGARRRDQGLGTKSSALSTERHGSTAYTEYIGVGEP
jgi:hypothetical protein